MGTRGAFGFRIDHQDKVTYNHMDSYPSGLGLSLVEYFMSLLYYPKEKLADLVRQLRLVDGDSTPSKKELDFLAQFNGIYELGLPQNMEDQTWFALLGSLQSDLDTILNDFPVFMEYQEFLYCSLFCEWAYIFNIDSNRLEIYKGLQTQPHRRGRYYEPTPEAIRAGKAGGMNTYYPVALIKEFELDENLTYNFTNWLATAKLD